MKLHATAAAVLCATIAIPLVAEDMIWNGEWASRGPVALTGYANGLNVWVAFITEREPCDLAALGVEGNGDIAALGMVVDGKVFEPAVVESLDHGVGLVITPEALAAIKQGTAAVLTSDLGVLGLHLRGSAKAINSAYGACMDAYQQAADELLRPIQPTKAATPGRWL